MAEWQLVVADLLAVLGTAGIVLSVVSTLAVREPNAKIHAASVAPVIGTSLILAASFARGDPVIATRALLVAVIAILGGAAGAHALLRIK